MTATMSSQTLALGRERGRIESALKRLERERALARLWEQDPGLWTQDPATQDMIRRRLGWLAIPRVMATQTAQLRAFAKETCQTGLTHALLLGMGGSSLFSEVCRKTFGVADGHADLTVLDTTDPTAIQRQQQGCSKERLFVIVSSKSGTTSEVGALSKYFYDIFTHQEGQAGDRCLAITDAGSPLEAQAKALRYRRAFVHGPDSGMDVGGRFSALTYFGLVPAALLGVDLDALLGQAGAMLDGCGAAIDCAKNPAAQLAAVLAALGEAGKDKITLLASPALESFGTWVEQLIAESLGKSGKGLVPVFGEPLRAPECYGDDRVFVELQLASERDEAIARQTEALERRGAAVVRIHWHDRYDLGGEVVKWEIATALIGYLMGLNPFDEPNVQESKDRTKALLATHAKVGRLPEEESLLHQDGIALFGSPSGRGAGTLSASLTAFLKLRRPRDYCAVLSFLPRTDALDQAARTMRDRLGEALGSPVMLGFGPRYLHSTGQLYKGGPDGGLLFLLTSEAETDLKVPGETFTFAVLKQAQALGDFQAMRQRQRRVLRIHLESGAEAAMTRFLGILDQALASLAGH